MVHPSSGRPGPPASEHLVLRRQQSPYPKHYYLQVASASQQRWKNRRGTLQPCGAESSAQGRRLCTPGRCQCQSRARRSLQDVKLERGIAWERKETWCCPLHFTVCCMLCCIMGCDGLWCSRNGVLMLCCVICCPCSCHGPFCCVMWCHVMLMLQCAMLCYAVPCHVMSCHAMPCHIIPLCCVMLLCWGYRVLLACRLGRLGSLHTSAPLL